jgi:uncharacterized protein YciI
MPYFVVINEAGPNWNNQRTMREQNGWDEHAKFIDKLADDHIIIMAGPLRGYSKHRAMLVINYDDEQELRRRLDLDPWFQNGILHNVDFYSWEILIGKPVPTPILE